MRKLVFTLHLVVGLAASILLVVLSLSGAIIAFEPELNRVLHPELTKVEVNGPRLGLDELKVRVERQSPGWRLVRFYLPETPEQSTYVRLRAAGTHRIHHIYVNPYTGLVLGSTEDGANLLIRIHDLHVNFLTGEIQGHPGNVLVMAGTWSLLALSVTGLVLWFPRKVFGFRGKASAARVNRDLHMSLGFWTSLAMFAFAMTGLGLHYQTGKLLSLLNRPENTATLAGHGNSIEAYLRTAREALPGAAIPRVLLPERAGDPVFLYLRFPEDKTPAGRSFVTLDARTGKVLSVGSSRTAPVLQSALVRFTREIHTGTIWGLPTRALAVLMSLALCVLALTGPMIYFNKRLAKRRGLREAARVRESRARLAQA